MNNTNSCKKFLGLLKNYSMRNAIDLFVYQHGFCEFLKVKKTLERFKNYATIYTEMQKHFRYKKKMFRGLKRVKVYFILLI